MNAQSSDTGEQAPHSDFSGNDLQGGPLRGSYGWPFALGLLALALCVTLFLYWSSAASAVSLWYNRSAYNHGFLILPISGYLIWRRRALLAALPPTPSLLGFLALGLSCGVWLVAHAADVSEGEHFALVAIFQSLFLALLGTRLFRAMLLPMCYLWLMVPTGTFFHPVLQSVATEISTLLLRLNGIPVFQEGFFIEVPTGGYEVAPGCSGLNFILAGLALSPLYGYLMYRSLKMRMAAIFTMLGLAVLANGIRIYAIIALAELTNRRIDIVDDHLVYGWGFFALVLLIAGYVGLKWADRDDLDEEVPTGATEFVGARLGVLAGLGALVLVSVLPLYLDLSVKAQAGATGGGIAVAALPLQSGPVTSSWAPEIAGTDHHYHGQGLLSGVPVSLYVGQFLYQSDGHELLTFSNDPAAARPFQRRGGKGVVVDIDGRKIPWRFETVRSQYENRLVAYTYFVDGRYTVSALEAKLLQAKATLLWGRPDAGVISLSMAQSNDASADEKRLKAALEALDLNTLFIRPDA